RSRELCRTSGSGSRGSAWRGTRKRSNASRLIWGSAPHLTEASVERNGVANGAAREVPGSGQPSRPCGQSLGVDLCATGPARVARFMAARGLWNYDMTLQALHELPYGKLREIDVADSLRFWSLRLHDVGAIKSSPQKTIERGMDLRFVNELKKE